VTEHDRTTAAAEEAAAEQAASDRAASAQPADDGPVPAGETASEPAPSEDDGRPDAAQPATPAADAARPAAPAADAPEPATPAEPDFQDRYLRTAAELDNVRKRARRDVAAAESRGIARLAKELLPALDNFERALASAENMPENADHHLTDGIRLVQAELLAALARVGIEPDSPRGETFDPHRHEAVAQQSVDGAAPGTIVEVFQSGYRYGDDLLRPAKVVVAA
jgi:molecular chaperone GrpE